MATAVPTTVSLGRDSERDTERPSDPVRRTAEGVSLDDHPDATQGALVSQITRQARSALGIDTSTLSSLAATVSGLTSAPEDERRASPAPAPEPSAPPMATTPTATHTATQVPHSAQHASEPTVECCEEQEQAPREQGLLSSLTSWIGSNLSRVGEAIRGRDAVTGRDVEAQPTEAPSVTGYVDRFLNWAGSVLGVSATYDRAQTETMTPEQQQEARERLAQEIEERLRNVENTEELVEEIRALEGISPEFKRELIEMIEERSAGFRQARDECRDGVCRIGERAHELAEEANRPDLHDQIEAEQSQSLERLDADTAAAERSANRVTIEQFLDRLRRGDDSPMPREHGEAMEQVISGLRNDFDETLEQTGQRMSALDSVLAHVADFARGVIQTFHEHTDELFDCLTTSCRNWCESLETRWTPATLFDGPYAMSHLSFYDEADTLERRTSVLAPPEDHRSTTAPHIVDSAVSFVSIESAPAVTKMFEALEARFLVDEHRLHADEVFVPALDERRVAEHREALERQSDEYNLRTGRNAITDLHGHTSAEVKMTLLQSRAVQRPRGKDFIPQREALIKDEDRFA